MKIKIDKKKLVKKVKLVKKIITQIWLFQVNESNIQQKQHNAAVHARH
jgi:hypothetical protein